jgi:GTP-binding protein
MKVTKAEFVTGAKEPEQYPFGDRDEIAFGGRSNVGKSTIIATLLNRKKLVRTSKKPGRTQMLNFYNINDDLYFVDLPGYGYAEVPDEVNVEWGGMIEQYLQIRRRLKGMIVAMDVRRGIQEADFQLLEALPHYGVQPVLVFTKADKLSTQNRKNRRRELARQSGVEPDDLIFFSSQDGAGIKEIWSRIHGLV